MLIPRQKTPNVRINTLDHGIFDLSEDSNRRGVILCFYRGLHCPLCSIYLKELDELIPSFTERGVGAIAISSDSNERTRKMVDKIGIKTLRFGYDFPLKEARNWGLYISTSRGTTSIGIEEPKLFAEPGLFMITAEKKLFYSYIQTMPFVRPQFRELLGALDFVIKNDYPARGEYTGSLED